MSWLTGDGLTTVLLGFYLLILIAYLKDAEWWKALYWVGAICIVASVRMMKP